jgi:hypothetical protein
VVAFLGRKVTGDAFLWRKAATAAPGLGVDRISGAT